MKIDELLSFLEEEGLSDYIEVVKEPEYSKQKLLTFQSEFEMSSSRFYEYYMSGLLENIFPSEMMQEWAYNYKIFINANGDLDDLNINSDEKNFEKGGRTAFFYLLFRNI